MKKFILYITVPGLLLANTSEVDLSWIDKEIAAIKPPRKGVSYRAISMLKDPIIFLKKEKEEKKQKNTQTPPPVVPSLSTSTTAIHQKNQNRSKGLKLMAIINNAALINHKWYRVGEKVGNYTIVKISYKEVTLKSKTRSLRLTTYTNKLKKQD